MKERTKIVAVIFFFLFTLGHALNRNTVGIDNPIAGQHDFRRSQTAITAYYLKEGGSFFNYETPVFGAPWSIPFEFPLYQGVVASFSYLSGLDLDMCGRLISLVFFYSSLLFFYGMSRRLGINRWASLIPLSLILASPVYLYWSRTFMIESTAMFFGAGYLYFIMKDNQRKSWHYPLLVVLFGCLGILVKVTTFAGYVYFAAFYCLMTIIKNYKESNKLPWTFIAKGFLCYAAIPLVIGLSWTFYADSLRAGNPMARDFITTKALEAWNYGTWSQRLDPNSWQRIFDFEVINVASYFGLFFLGIALWAKSRIWSLGFFISYIGTTLTFFNLHYVHDYYVYGNGVFLLMAIGIGIGHLVERGIEPVPVLFILLLCIQGSINRYYDTYWKDQKKNFSEPNISLEIRNNTQPDDVIIIWGADWSSMIAYHAQRRALMDRWDMKTDNPKMQEALSSISQYNIGALIFCNRPDEFIMEKIDFFKFHDKHVSRDGCRGYFSKSLSSEKML